MVVVGTAVGTAVGTSIIVDFQRHPLSAVWGDMSGDVAADFARGLEMEIDDSGLDIYMRDGMVLDGWQRYLQFCRLGVQPRFIEYTGHDPAGFVIRRNAHRRQLSAGQRALAIRDAREWSGMQLNGSTAELEELAAQAEVSDRTMMRAIKADNAGLGNLVRSGDLRADVAADIAAHEDVARNLKSGRISVDDAVKEVKARKPLSRADRLEAELSLLRRDIERERQKIDRLEKENKFLRSLSSDDDGDEVKRQFGNQRRMINTLRSSTHQWMEHYRQLMSSRDYWRSNARKMGHHPSSLDSAEVDRMDELEIEVDIDMASTSEYLDAVDEFLDKNEPPPISLESNSPARSAPSAPSPGSGPTGAYSGAGAIVDVGDAIPGSEVMEDPEDDLWLYDLDLDNPQTLETIMEREIADGPSGDLDDGFDNLDDIYAEEASYEDDPDDVSDGPSEDSYGQMRMGGDMGDVPRTYGHERPSGYRHRDRDRDRD